MLFHQRFVSVDEFESRSEWHLRPEGLCRDDMCVPLRDSPVRGGGLDLEVVSQTLEMALVHDEDLWALGPRVTRHTLETARGPALTLPDVHGEPFDLAGLLGTKVLLLAWASW